ncbi:MAG: sugar phosphate isomerase/epimerase [Candidatus Hydrogenedentes bacterium]|nr:sugar phosphate isomerase/epimerase [Candidatus Hydrogenedentota bacterium]
MPDTSLDRREFLARSTAAVVGAGVIAAGAGAAETATAYPPLPRAIIHSMLPKGLSDPDKFALAKKCGFDGIESQPVADLAQAKTRGDQARAAGVPIHSVIYGGWEALLSDPDSAVVDKGKAAIETALRSAKAMGADNILLVPAKVTAQVRYVEAYERSQKHIRELLPLAEELKIIIAVEEVWNDFLLSPLEFARYVDEFNNPWLRAYFDVGNVVAFGYPQDWIRTLGKRIVKVHLKDFKRETRQWPNLRDGDINWPEVRKAFAEVGYTGFVTAELSGGDEAYLKDLSQRMTKIVSGV